MLRNAIRILLLALVPCLAVHAQTAAQPTTQAQIAALQQQVQNAQMSGDNAWMLVSRRWCC